MLLSKIYNLILEWITAILLIFLGLLVGVYTLVNLKVV